MITVSVANLFAAFSLGIALGTFSINIFSVNKNREKEILMREQRLSAIEHNLAMLNRDFEGFTSMVRLHLKNLPQESPLKLE